MDLSVYSTLFEIIAPICVIVLIGYCLGSKIDIAGASRLVMLVGTPALVFSTMTKTDLPTALLLEVSMAAMCVCLAAIVYAVVALKFLGKSLGTYLPAMTMPNAGSLGLSLVLLAFGDDGLSFGIAFYIVIAIFQYSIMPIVVQGKFSVKSVLQEPLIWAVAAALIVLFMELQVPKVIADTTKILGGMMIPIMLLLLGASISSLGFNDLKNSLYLALLRLAIGLAAGVTAILLLGTSGIASGTIFLMATMPSALVTYLIAARHNKDPDLVAGMVFTSTVLTFAVLPLLILGALYIAEI